MWWWWWVRPAGGRSRPRWETCFRCGSSNTPGASPKGGTGARAGAEVWGKARAPGPSTINQPPWGPSRPLPPPPPPAGAPPGPPLHRLLLSKFLVRFLVLLTELSGSLPEHLLVEPGLLAARGRARGGAWPPGPGPAPPPGPGRGGRAPRGAGTATSRPPRCCWPVGALRVFAPQPSRGRGCRGPAGGPPGPRPRGPRGGRAHSSGTLPPAAPPAARDPAAAFNEGRGRPPHTSVSLHLCVTPAERRTAGAPADRRAPSPPPQPSARARRSRAARSGAGRGWRTRR